MECLEKALEQYRWVTDYHSRHREDVEGVFGEEVRVCQEMVELLPVRIASLHSEH